MGLRLIKVIAAVSLITACAKTSVPETVGGSDEIVVSIADSQFNTKCILDGLTPSFTFGDTINVSDGSASATYIYKSKQSANSEEKYVFQKVFNSGTIDTAKICRASYPVSFECGQWSFTYNFPTEQKFTTINGMQKISAPMACLEPINQELVFSNIACLIKIGIICDSVLDNTIAIDTIKVTSTIAYMSGLYTLYPPSTGMMATGGTSSTYLVGCKSSGVLSSSKVTYFYIILPPIFDLVMPQVNSDTFTVEVVLDKVGSLPPRSFTATKGGSYNQITKNTIIEFDPIIIKPEDLL